MESSALRFTVPASGCKIGLPFGKSLMVKRRKSKVPPPPVECPLNECMRMLGSAWTAHVIWYLREGERCFTELQTDIAGVSARVLTSSLRKLQSNGVIHRYSKRTSPPTVWYALTPVGQELAGALAQVIDITQRLHQPD